MVDELMLQDVNNILKKIELIRSREDFKRILKENDLTNASLDEVNEFLVTKFMTEDELVLYKKYLLYKRKADLKKLGIAIDSIEELTTNISIYYEENSRCRKKVNEIQEIIAKIEHNLRDYPNIRVSTAYHNVKHGYKRYFDAYIKDGMDRAVFTEEIDKINHSSIIIKSLKKKRLKQLREGLIEHNKNSKLHVDTLYKDYLKSREEYGLYLKDVMTTMLSKSPILYEAGILGLKSIYQEDIPIKILSNGVKVVDKTKCSDITPVYISAKIFEYFQKLQEPEFDEKTFIKAFKEFLLDFYTKELTGLNKEANTSLKKIREAFNKQRDIARMLNTYHDIIEEPTITLDKDTEDTFALVYQNNKPNN